MKKSAAYNLFGTHSLDRSFLRLARTNPDVGKPLGSILKEAGKWDKLPKGWTQESVKKFWNSLTGEAKHKVTRCMKEMEGKIDDTGAFCASLADKVDPGWRSRRAGAGTNFRQYVADAEKGFLEEAAKLIKTIAGSHGKVYFIKTVGPDPILVYQGQDRADNDLEMFFFIGMTNYAEVKIDWNGKNLYGHFDDSKTVRAVDLTPDFISGIFRSIFGGSAVTSSTQKPKTAVSESSGLDGYLGKKIRLVPLAKKDLADLVRSRPDYYNPKACTTGLIRNMFEKVSSLRDPVLAKALWTLWETRGPSQDDTAGTQKLAMKFGQLFGREGHATAKLQAAAFSVALLRATRQPLLADRAEALFVKQLASEMAENPPVATPGTGTPATPAAIFVREYVEKDPYKAFALELKTKSGGVVDKARALASDLLTEVNWYGLANQVGGDDSLLTQEDQELVQDINTQVSYDTLGAAGVAAALLLAVGDRSMVKTIIRQVVSDQADTLIQLDAEG